MNRLTQEKRQASGLQTVHDHSTIVFHIFSAVQLISMETPLVQDPLMDRHEGQCRQLRIIFLLDEPLPDSGSDDVFEEMSILVMYLFEGRKEIHVRIELCGQMVQKQAKIRVLHGKVCAETDCTVEFSNGIRRVVGDSPNQVINVSGFVFTDDPEKQLAFAVEVRVEGRLGHPDLLHDVIDGGPVIPLPNKKLKRSLDDPIFCFLSLSHDGTALKEMRVECESGYCKRFACAEVQSGATPATCV
jgi:hypothetical protein